MKRGVHLPLCTPTQSPQMTQGRQRRQKGSGVQIQALGSLPRLRLSW